MPNLGSMFFYEPYYLQKLKKQIANKELILFIGAGLSRGIGLPDWPNLIKSLMSKLDLPYNEERYRSQGADYLQCCANEIEQQCASRNSSLKENLKSLFDGIRYDDAGWRLQNDIIKMLFPQGGIIVTTNYDNTIETVAEGMSLDVMSYPYKEIDLAELDFNRLRNDEKLHIIKIHGDCYTSNSEIILSKNSYNTAYMHNAPCSRILTELDHQNVLFIGCSFSDPYFLKSRTTNGAGDWYALYPTTESSDVINAALDSEKDSTKEPIKSCFKEFKLHGFYYKIKDMENEGQHRESISSFVKTINGFVQIRSQEDFQKANDEEVTVLMICQNMTAYSWKIGDYSNLKNNLTRVVFENGYSGVLPEFAFANCQKLEEVILSDGISGFKQNCFFSCYKLKTIKTREGDFIQENHLQNITNVADYAFQNCVALRFLDFSRCTELTTIKKSAFSGCKGLIEIRLPVSIRAIEGNAFRDCCKLDRINLYQLENCSKIGESCFLGCGALRYVEFPSSLKSLGRATFDSDTSLSLVEISNTNLEVINEHTFHQCKNLKTIILPKTLKKIDKLAFKDCNSLQLVVCTSELKIEDAAFYGLETVRIVKL